MLFSATRTAGLFVVALNSAVALAQVEGEPAPAAPGAGEVQQQPLSTPPSSANAEVGAAGEPVAAESDLGEPAATQPTVPPAAAPAAEALGAAPLPLKSKEDWWVPALFGDPVAYSRRPPTNRFLALEVNLKYALVGTGPTRFVNEIRFSPLDFLELSTQVGPVILPERATFRVSAGSWRKTGRLGFEGGLHKVDLGARLFPDTGESRGFNPNIVPSANLVAAFTYDFPVWDRFSIHLSARAQQRVQVSARRALVGNFENTWDQMSMQLAAQGSWDITQQLALTVGTAYGTAVDNQFFVRVFKRAGNGTKPWDDAELPRLDLQRAVDQKDPSAILNTRGQCGEAKTRTLFIDFAETARPGYATLVDRDNNCSASVSGALTYGRTESFDVDLFGAARVWPSLGGLFGAGIRWRLAP